MRFADERRTVNPTAISASAATAKIHSGSPVNGSLVEATVLPRRVVAPRTPPAGFVFDGWSAMTAPFTPPAATGDAATGAAAAGAEAVAGAAAPAGVAVAAVAAATLPAAVGDEVEVTSVFVLPLFEPVGTETVF